jgi:hypothetical protein
VNEFRVVHLESCAPSNPIPRQPRSTAGINKGFAIQGLLLEKFVRKLALPKRCLLLL